MKKNTLFLILLILAVLLAGCGTASTDEKELNGTAVYKDFTLVLGEAERFSDDRGKNLVRISAAYTNASQDPCYAFSCFAVRAFQNDKQIADISDVNKGEAALIREIKNGETIEVSYVFVLENESAALEILVGEPTAEMATIARKLYEQLLFK